jgi:transposase
MGKDGAALLGQVDRSRTQRWRQPTVPGGRFVDSADRQSLARLAVCLWQMEHDLQAFPRLGNGRCFQEDFRCRVGRSRYGIRHDRRHHRQGPSPRPRLKRGTQSQAIGKSKGGWTTKILALTDALGNLVRFHLLPGQRYDTIGVAPLIDGIAFGALIADKAFDSNWIIAELNERGAGIVISQRPNRLEPIAIDAEIYKWRHLIENFFCKLKEFKRIAMRSDKTDQSFEAMIYLCSAVINSR